MRRARRAALAFAIAAAIFSIYGLEYLFARVIVGSMKPFNAAQITPEQTDRDRVARQRQLARDGLGRTHRSSSRSRRLRRENSRLSGCLAVNPAVVDPVGWESASAPAGGPRRRGDARTSGGAGRPADRILVETESGTTRDEALIVDRMLKAQGSSRSFWLPAKLTCAALAWRSLRSVGIEATPAIARSSCADKPHGPIYCCPARATDLGSQNPSNEILGLGYYWLRRMASMIAHVVLVKPKKGLSRDARRAFVEAFEKGGQGNPLAMTRRQFGRRIKIGAGYDASRPMPPTTWPGSSSTMSLACRRTSHPAHEELGFRFNCRDAPTFTTSNWKALKDWRDS